MLRALVEFRIRGVKVYPSYLCDMFVIYHIFQTNIPFLFRLLTHDVFVGGKTWTTVCILLQRAMDMIAKTHFS